MKKKLLILGLFIAMISNAVACNNTQAPEISVNVESGVKEEKSVFSMDAKPIDGKEYEHNGFVYMMYDDGSVEITKYLGTDTSVKIEEVNGYKVSRIGSSAFEGCTTIEDIYLYADLIFIGDCAFKGCTSLEDFKIPESMISIGESAFEGCIAMTDVYLYADLTAIADYTFKGCTSLEDFKLPESMINVGVSAFEGCTAMTDVYVYGGKTIGDYAFKGCSSLEDFKIPEGMTSIGESAFEGCISMTDVYVYSDDVTYGLNAFANCPNLEEMPEGAVNEYIRDNDSAEDFIEKTVFDSSGSSNTSSGSYNHYCEASGCYREGIKSYVGIYGTTEYYCATHYDELIDIMSDMEEDVGNGSYSKHTCEECGREGTHSMIGISGSTEYYCSTHYRELKELMDMMGLY